MSEKRFDYVQGNGGFFFVDKNKLVDYDESFGDYDNYLSYVTDNCLEWKEIVDLLNSLVEENEQLRTDNKQLKADAKIVLLILQAIGKLPFKISVSEAKAIKRLSENVGELFDD